MLSNHPAAQPETAALTVTPVAGFWGRLLMQVAAAGDTVAEWRRRRRSRQELRALSPYEVRDFCLDPMSAEHETTKPFWRA